MSSYLLAGALGGVGGLVGLGIARLAVARLNANPRWLVIAPLVLGLLISLAGGRIASAATDPLAAEMAASPTLQIIKTHFPADYAKLEADARAAGSPLAARGAIEAAISALIQRERVRADAESSVAVFRTTRNFGGAIQKLDPMKCAQFWQLGDGSAIREVMTPALMAEDVAASRRLLDQVGKRPAPTAQPMTEDALVDIIAKSLAPMPEADRDLAVAVLEAERVANTSAEARVVCQLYQNIADTLLDGPTDIAGERVRSYWALN